MRKITFLLALLFTFVGVVPSMAFNDLNIDVSKTYTIKTSNSYYLYLTTSGKYTFVTYDTGKNEDLTNEIYHFVFEETGEVSSSGNKLYYIRPVTSQNYAYDMTVDTRGVYFKDGKKTTWCVVDDGEGNHLITSSDCSLWWRPASANNPVYISNILGVSRNLKIEATDGSELGGGESGGNEGEGESDETTYFRLKEKGTGKYFTILNNTWNTGATSGVNLSALNPTNDGQVFTKEASGVGFKIKAKTGYYIKLHQWNVNASTTNVDDATIIRFNEVGENEYTFSWNNTFSSYALNYIKVENVSGTWYPFCDAAESFAATWVLEEIPAPISVNLAEITASDNLLSNIVGRIGTFSAPHATTIPSGVTAYYAQPSEVNGTDVISLKALEGGVVPANFGVLLVGSAEQVSMEPSYTSVAVPENAFSHSAGADVTLPENSYILVRGDLGIGFYPAKVGSTLKANKTYLNLGTSNVSAFKLMVDEVTAIESVVTGKTNSAIYDLSGRRVLNTVKGGIYIQNGKKFIVK